MTSIYNSLQIILKLQWRPVMPVSFKYISVHLHTSGDGGGGQWLVWLEWRPAGWSLCLPLLIFSCTIKSRSSLLAPAHPGCPGKRAVKRLWCVRWWHVCCSTEKSTTFLKQCLRRRSTTKRWRKIRRLVMKSPRLSRKMKSRSENYRNTLLSHVKPRAVWEQDTVFNVVHKTSDIRVSMK